MSGGVGPELVLDARACLGEGPTWDTATGTLLFVDIIAPAVHRFDPVADGAAVMPMPSLVGAVVPRAGGGLLLALEDGFWIVEADGEAPRLLAAVEAENAATRMNDGKCDRAGRFWGGTMGRKGEGTPGSLYRLDPDGTVTHMLDGVAISNGLGWSPDNRTMYYIDTMTRGLDAFDFDLATGSIASRRRLVTFPDGAAVPDGMTVDADGGLWVAFYWGGKLERYTSDGVLERTVRLPVLNVTSCAFGGADLGDLYITTAWSGLSDAQRANQPTAGGLFRLRPGVRGIAEVPFLG